ncbi:MAG TPA: DnaJ domain-containing protein [Noviherbaspirillum sp.]|nr:DnaJ domain-containing protein [Noviherbaspirillum sp.]
MKTLYDVLGVSSQASAAQIEAGYKFCLESLASKESNDEELIRAKAIKEAYDVLSSPSRRQTYDEKLKSKTQVTYQVVEKEEFPWLKIAFVLLLLGGGFFLYKHQANKAETERLALEAAKVKAQAEIAEKEATAAAARLEQQRIQEQRNAEINHQREMEQARREGQLIHERMQRMEAQAAREKEREEQQARYERQREEQAAQARKRSEIAAMERALSIPIRRH